MIYKFGISDPVISSRLSFVKPRYNNNIQLNDYGVKWYWSINESLYINIAIIEFTYRHKSYLYFPANSNFDYTLWSWDIIC